MKKRFYLLFLCIAFGFSLVTCTPEDDKKLSGTFQIVVSANHFKDGTGYVVIYDKSGKLLNEKAIENGGTYNLNLYDQPADSRYNVLLFKQELQTNRTNQETLNTIDYYMDIAVRTIYLRDYPPMVEYTPIGQLNVTLSGIEINDYIQRSAGSSITSDGFNENPFTINQYFENDGYLINLGKENETPTYCFIPNAGLNENIVLTADNFSPMTGSKTIQLPALPRSSLTISSRDFSETEHYESFDIFHVTVDGLEQKQFIIPVKFLQDTGLTILPTRGPAFLHILPYLIKYPIRLKNLM
jgi:hypothetical protein